jgi:hypothetical protein
MRLRKIITPFLPFVIAAVGFIPKLGLRSPITAWPTAETMYFLGFLFVALIWLLFEIMFVLRRDTDIEDLALDCLLQTIVAIVFAALGGYFLAGGGLFGQNSLEWWFAIPMFVAILDAIISNAYVVRAAKSIVEESRSVRQPAKTEGAPGISRMGLH